MKNQKVNSMSNKSKISSTIVAAVCGVYILAVYAVRHIKEDENINDKNPYLKDNNNKTVLEISSSYGAWVKPIFDQLFSFGGLIFFAPVYVIIAILIYLDDPGPIFFLQTRVGKNKSFFQLHKFRTMKLNAPHDVPTHQLENPEQYITPIGSILRKYSLDELPQIWDIFRGKMSVIGPRPALWNQEDLVTEREKYGANNILPGLTGWAQINGRDELSISDKAKLDGEYTNYLKQGGWKALFFDMKCLVKTVTCVLKRDGVIEGGTGMIGKSL